MNLTKPGTAPAQPFNFFNFCLYKHNTTDLKEKIGNVPLTWGAGTPQFLQEGGKTPLRGAQEAAEKGAGLCPSCLSGAHSSSCGCCTAESHQLIHQTQLLQTWQELSPLPMAGNDLLSPWQCHPPPASPGTIPSPNPRDAQGRLQLSSSIALKSSSSFQEF